MATRTLSFKLASPGPVLGTLQSDEATGIYGRIGPVPEMIPLNIHVERPDVDGSRDFRCQLAIDKSLTPLILRMALQGASEVYGAFPPEHSLEYEVNMQLADQDPIRFTNVSSDKEAMEPASEVGSVASLLMDNPYKAVDIKQIDVSLRILSRSRMGEIWSVRLSDTKVKPGQWITADVVLESYRTEKIVQPVRLQIPADLKPGQYILQILSQNDYLAFQRKSAPHRYTVEDVPSLLTAVRSILHTPRNQLVAVLQLPPGGIAIRNQELPDLPPSRALLLQDDRRFTPSCSTGSRARPRWTGSPPVI